MSNFGRTDEFRRCMECSVNPRDIPAHAHVVINKQGYIRYIDIHDIDEQPDNHIMLEVLGRYRPEAALRGPALPPIKLEDIQLPHGGVVMYCTP